MTGTEPHHLHRRPWHAAQGRGRQFRWHTYDVAGTAERGEIAFERPHLRSQDELAMIQDPCNRVVDGGAEATALRGYVNERDRWRIGTQIHGTPVDRTAVSQRRRAGLFVWRAQPRLDA